MALILENNMGLIDQAKKDIAQITSNLNEFGVEINLIYAPVTLPATEPVTATITGLFSQHHFGVNTDGQTVNSKNAYMSFSESLLIDYPLRNEAGEVNLRGHKAVIHNTEYTIREWFPDDTIGLIVCILGI